MKEESAKNTQDNKPSEQARRIDKVAEDIVNKIRRGKVVPVVGNMLHKNKTGGNIFDSFFESVKKHSIDNVDTSDVCFSDVLIKFLIAGKFPLILTTSTFDTLDDTLNSEGLNISPHFHTWGDENCTNIVSLPQNGTLVYHLFGESGGQMAESERDFLECLLSYQNSRDNTLSTLLRGKQILLLEGSLPNWLFLLLWYPLMKNTGNKYLFDQDYENDPDFESCLNSLNFKTEEAMNKFLEAALVKLNPPIVNTAPREFKYDVFLSYKSEDMEFAQKIYNHLTEECGLRVWFDKARNEMMHPGEYYRRIAEGLDQSRTFMPVIGPHFAMRFMKYKDNPSESPAAEDLGVITETYMALERKRGILSTNGLDFYEIPVWDMDKISEFAEIYFLPAFEKLGIFQFISRYSYTDEDNKVFDGFIDFKSIDWSNLLKTKQSNR